MSNEQYCAIEDFARDLKKNFISLAQSKNDLSKEVGETVMRIIDLQLELVRIEREKSICEEAEYYKDEMRILQSTRN